MGAVRFWAGIGPANMKQPVISLSPAALAAMEDEKKEDLVVEEVDGIGSELSSPAKEAHEALKGAMKSV